MRASCHGQPLLRLASPSARAVPNTGLGLTRQLRSARIEVLKLQAFEPGQFKAAMLNTIKQSGSQRYCICLHLCLLDVLAQSLLFEIQEWTNTDLHPSRDPDYNFHGIRQRCSGCCTCTHTCAHTRAHAHAYARTHGLSKRLFHP